MKQTKKLFSVLLIIMMLFSITAPAMAADGFTITIKNDSKGHTYEAYQIFTGDLYTPEGTEKSILSNITWGTGVNNTNLLAALKSDNALNSYFKDCTTAAEVADALSEEDNKIDPDDFAAIVGKYLTTPAKVSQYNETEKVYTISDLDAGYYFVKDKDNSVADGDAYTKFVLQIVGNVEVIPKSVVPTVEKKVKENVKYNENGGYNDVADYNIGDSVPFAFYSKVPNMEHYKEFKYVFHDTMSNGLTFDDNVTVTIGGTKLTENQYTVETAGLDDTCTFHVEIADLKKIDAATKGAEIRVDFTATLNENAEIGSKGNDNKVFLEFSNNPNDPTTTTETPEDKVIVFTYELDVTKIAGEKDEEEKDIKLQGAEFVLYREIGTEREYVQVNKEKDNRVTGWTENKADASTLTSDANGLFKVIGLDDGTYYLEETKAPDGYNKLEKPITLEIKATTANGQNWDGVENALTALKISIDGSENDGVVATGIVSMNVVNNSGATLPETGGMGTTIFYVVGGVLVVGAVVLLITKRRMNAGH